MQGLSGIALIDAFLLQGCSPNLGGTFKLVVARASAEFLSSQVWSYSQCQLDIHVQPQSVNGCEVGACVVNSAA